MKEMQSASPDKLFLQEAPCLNFMYTREKVAVNEKVIRQRPRQADLLCWPKL